MISVYLAGPSEMQSEIREFRDYLYSKWSHMFKVTAKWLDQELDLEFLTGEIIDKQINDIYNAIQESSIFVIFELPQWHGRGTGGRHVELGLALSSKFTKIIVVGIINNVFHLAPRIKRIPAMSMEDPNLFDEIKKEIEACYNDLHNWAAEN